jgi:type I restriction enzyme, S subunit
MSELPESWADGTTVEDVAEIRSGNGFPKSYQGRTEGELPFFKVGDISRNWQHGQITLTKAEHYLTRDESKEIRANTLPEGSVVFAKIGAAVALNRRAILGIEALVDNNVMGLIPSDATTSRFLFYFMCQVDLGTATRGGAVPSLRKGDVATLNLPLPPFPEQIRIVGRIEELFSRLDAGVTALRHAKTQLQRYRQSVLAAAVTGQLTQAWREQHPDIEPASELLERVLKHKREQWVGKRKYKEPPVPVTDGLLKLPVSWTWATVEQQAAAEERAITDGPFGSKLKSRHYTESGPRVLRLQNIGDGVFKDECAHISEEHFETLLKHQIFAGDLVIRALGIPAHQACMVPPSVGLAIVKADCIRFKVFEPHINPRFILFALNSHPVRSRSEKHVHGVGRPRLNGVEIKSLALPLAPLAEQNQIVAEVEARMTAIDHLEAEIEVQLMRASVLGKSTLNFAYSGKLVPQNPSDGSARSLLQLTKKAKQNSVKIPSRKSAKTPKPPKKKGALKKPAIPKEMQPDLRSAVVNKISKMKKDQFTFEDLFDSINAEYDEAKDVIFALLEDSKPMIKQEFDKESQRLVFTRNPLK